MWNGGDSLVFFFFGKGAERQGVIAIHIWLLLRIICNGDDSDADDEWMVMDRYLT
jgi:hypothetical protein